MQIQQLPMDLRKYIYQFLSFEHCEYCYDQVCYYRIPSNRLYCTFSCELLDNTVNIYHTGSTMIIIYASWHYYRPITIFIESVWTFACLLYVFALVVVLFPIVYMYFILRMIWFVVVFNLENIFLFHFRI